MNEWLKNVFAGYGQIALKGWICTGLVLLPGLAGCGSSYTVPGGPADFRAFGVTEDFVDEHTDISIAQQLDRKPLASFPTIIAVVRVQDEAYQWGYGSGNYTVMPVRDLETPEQFEQLRTLPMVRDIAPLNLLVLPKHSESDKQLRQGAAAVHADMLLIYTFDSIFTSQQTLVVDLLTLGLFPHETSISCTASAVIMDTRNGYVYGLAEATSKKQQRTNGWALPTVIEAARQEAEAEALKDLFEQFEQTWQGVIDHYGPANRSMKVGA